MKRQRIFLVIGTVFVSLVTIPATFGGWQLSESNPGASGERVPFTAFEITERFDSEGNAARPLFYLYAFRSDGSFVKKKQMVGNRVVGFRVILDTTLGRKVVVEEFSESTSTYPLRDEGYLRSFSEKPVTCTQRPNAEWDQLLGYDVVKVEGETEASTWEMWVAPALDCFPLRSVRTVIKENGTPGARNEAKVVAVVEGEPDDSLFEIPSNYIERTPSEVSAELERIMGQPGSDVRRLEGLDRAYWAHQTP